MRKLVALLTALVLITFQITAFSATAEPATVGWWWQLQQLPAVLPVTLPAPPLVAKSELLVESLLGDTGAIAAVQVFLPIGRLAKTLTLQVTPVVGKPMLSACASASGWAPAIAGSWDLRPTCGRAAIPFTSNKAGTVLTVDVSKLAEPGQLDVVISPTLGGGNTFSALIHAPDTDALTTVAAPAVTTTTPTTTVPTVPPQPDLTVPIPPVTQPLTVTTPAPVTSPAVPTAPQVLSQPTIAAPLPVAKARAEHRTLLIVLLIAVILAAGGLSRVPTRAPRTLVRTAGAGEQ